MLSPPAALMPSALRLLLPPLLAAAATQTSPGPASVDPATRGPAVGQAIPKLEARDQDGRPRDFSSLAGPHGLVLVFFRSADW